MKTKLTTIPDFVVRHVDKVLVEAQAETGRAGGQVPALRFFRNGNEFSLPMTHDCLVKIGREMRNMDRTASYVKRMGTEFVFLAAQVATRSENPASCAEDQRCFFAMIGHVLRQVAPQAFFVSIPIHTEPGTSESHLLRNVLVGGLLQPSIPNALLVMGVNQVRSYTVVAPFSIGDARKLGYSKPRVFDSLRGHDHGGAIFTEIYEPSKN